MKTLAHRAAATGIADRIAQERFGIQGLQLMEQAALGARDCLARRGPGGKPSVAIFCGPGNNGGDGLALGRLLACRGHKVGLFTLCDPAAYRGDAAINLKGAVALGLPLTILDAQRPLEGQLGGLGGPDVVVDALLGTGATRPPDAFLGELLERLNSLAAFRLALDLPTGVHPDSGEVATVAFRAHATAVFGALKPGLLQYPGREYCGQLDLVPLSIPAQAWPPGGILALLGRGDLPCLPPRPQNAHKNRFGHVLLAAGSAGKEGAAVLASLGALRGGAGLATLLGRGPQLGELAATLPELMVHRLDLEPLALAAVLPGKQAVVAGPGLGLDGAGRALVEELVSTCRVPLVLDGDALSVFSGRADQLAGAACPLVLTPHPGEFARLLGLDPKALVGQRLELAEQCARTCRAVVVLKGAGTVVAAPDGRLALNGSGGSQLAKAGSGDVLAGLLGALLGQGMEPFDAACVAVHLHGLASERAAQTFGHRGLLASETAEALGPLLEQWEVPDDH